MSACPSGRKRLAVYEKWIYDVWGNEEEGYTVNDRMCDHRRLHLIQEEVVYNADLPCEFRDWRVPDEELDKAFEIDVCEFDGEDDGTLVYYLSRNEKPIGELVFQGVVNERGELVEV